jgi:hypothetical protein
MGTIRGATGADPNYRLLGSARKEKSIGFYYVCRGISRLFKRILEALLLGGGTGVGKR